MPPSATTRCRTDRGGRAAGVADGGRGPALQQTTVQLCHDHEGLTVIETATDNNVFSNASKCHDNVWTNDAMEMMVSPGLETPTNYTEIDVSPTAALWAGRIYNPTGLHPQNTTLLDCTCGIKWAAHTTPTGWSAQLYVPFKVILDPPRAELPVLWRINFFRTDMAKGTAGLEYSCWSSTFHTPPDFHIPRFFGIMVLD